MMGTEFLHPRCVTLKAFFMSETLITQAQWRAVTKLPEVKGKIYPDRSRFQGDNLPVENVSWHEAVEFCARLSQHVRRPCSLPTEAQWEYACRAGTTTPYSCGGYLAKSQANYGGKATSPVKKYPPNPWGLYDMHGNVWEWCLDDWHEDFDDAPCDGSAWLNSKKNTKVLRGGSWFSDPHACRTAYRISNHPANLSGIVGFRVCVAM